MLTQMAVLGWSSPCTYRRPRDGTTLDVSSVFEVGDATYQCGSQLFQGFHGTQGFFGGLIDLGRLAGDHFDFLADGGRHRGLFLGRGGDLRSLITDVLDRVTDGAQSSVDQADLLAHAFRGLDAVLHGGARFLGTG